jgi:hypothetical protein
VEAAANVVLNVTFVHRSDLVGFAGALGALRRGAGAGKRGAACSPLLPFPTPMLRCRPFSRATTIAPSFSLRPSDGPGHASMVVVTPYLPGTQAQGPGEEISPENVAYPGGRRRGLPLCTARPTAAAHQRVVA